MNRQATQARPIPTRAPAKPGVRLQVQLHELLMDRGPLRLGEIISAVPAQTSDARRALQAMAREGLAEHDGTRWRSSVARPRGGGAPADVPPPSPPTNPAPATKPATSSPGAAGASLESRVLAALAFGPRTASDLRSELGLGIKQSHNVLGRLRRQGKIESRGKRGSKTYHLTASRPAEARRGGPGETGAPTTATARVRQASLTAEHLTTIHDLCGRMGVPEAPTHLPPDVQAAWRLGFLEGSRGR